MFGEAACHYAYDTLVPARVIDEHRLLVAYVHLVDHRKCLLGDALVEFLARLIILSNVVGTDLRCFLVLGNHEIDSLLAAHHSSRGVDARTDLEDYVGVGDGLVGESALFDDALYAGARTVVETAQAGV